jgi:flagellar assembly protein FliH
MSLSKLVVFDRPLLGASAVVKARTRSLTEAELQDMREEARREGAEDARHFADSQMVEMRTEVQQLNESLFEALRQSEARLADQVRSALPGLAVEIGRRLLAGWEPPAEVVERICHEALDELYPETTGLELVVSARDSELLEKLNPGWLAEFSNLKISIDSNLHPGDCLVHSRFGVVDARGATRLRSLQESLANA